MTPDAPDSEAVERPLIPDARFFEQATEQVGHSDRMMVTLFSGLIAGTVLLLLKEEVSPWVGGFLFVALAMFVLGIGHTLLHITFHQKMLLLLEALVNGTKHVPNPVESEEPTVQAYTRIQIYAQRAYSGQLLYLFLGVTVAAIGVVGRLWCYSWRGGVVLAVIAAIFSCGAILVRLWLNPIRAQTSNRCNAGQEEQ